METIKSWFSTKTPRGRAVRTFIQAAVGFTTAATAIVSLPEFGEFMNSLGLLPQLLVVAGWTGVLSRVMFAIEQWYKKLSAWAEKEEYNV